MKNFIKIAIFSLMVFLLASCACNRTNNEPSTPLAFELQEDVTITSTDSTDVILMQGSVVYVYEDDDILNYTLLLNRDMLDDNETYRKVLVRMGMINDTTQVVGYTNLGVLTKQKRL
jgi:hypothetical protein